MENRSLLHLDHLLLLRVRLFSSLWADHVIFIPPHFLFYLLLCCWVCFSRLTEVCMICHNFTSGCCLLCFRLLCTAVIIPLNSLKHNKVYEFISSTEHVFPAEGRYCVLWAQSTLGTWVSAIAWIDVHKSEWHTPLDHWDRQSSYTFVLHVLCFLLPCELGLVWCHWNEMLTVQTYCTIPWVMFFFLLTYFRCNDGK